jgi:hypothetical protein
MKTVAIYRHPFPGEAIHMTRYRSSWIRVPTEVVMLTHYSVCYFQLVSGSCEVPVAAVTPQQTHQLPSGLGEASSPPVQATSLGFLVLSVLKPLTQCLLLLPFVQLIMPASKAENSFCSQSHRRNLKQDWRLKRQFHGPSNKMDVSGPNF